MFLNISMSLFFIQSLKDWSRHSLPPRQAVCRLTGSLILDRYRCNDSNIDFDEVIGVAMTGMSEEDQRWKVYLRSAACPAH